jgi:hypothetical protein
MQSIKRILDEKSGYFYFTKCKDAIRSLKNSTSDVPNQAGIYLVFSQLIIDKNKSHLHYQINDTQHELIYFGKAGGVTKSGRLIKQGLNGRINNVTSDSSRGFKHIKRAIYWNSILEEYGMNKIYICYLLNPNPLIIEGEIYNFLNDNDLDYPLLNKKLGRKID